MSTGRTYGTVFFAVLYDSQDDIAGWRLSWPFLYSYKQLSELKGLSFISSRSEKTCQDSSQRLTDHLLLMVTPGLLIFC